MEQFNLGAKKDLYDRKDFHIATIASAIEEPKEFFIATRFTQPVKMQYQRPTCTNQAFVASRHSDENGEISAPFGMAQTKLLESYPFEGAYTRNAFVAGNKVGCVFETDYPEPDASMTWNEYIRPSRIPQSVLDKAKDHKIGSYWRVEIPNLFNALYQFNKDLPSEKQKGIVCSMDWTKGFNHPDSSGLLPSYIQSDSVGGHAVYYQGKETTYAHSYHWFKNSWSKNWGKEGYFCIKEEELGKSLWDAWLALDEKGFPVEERYGEIRTWNKYLQEKAFAFNTWLFNKIHRLPNNIEISAAVYGYWSYEEIFTDKIGKVWLYYTKPAAKQLGLI